MKEWFKSYKASLSNMPDDFHSLGQMKEEAQREMPAMRMQTLPVTTGDS